MTKREIVGAVVAAVLGSVGSLWAFSRDIVTKDESREIARSIVNEYNGQVLSRLSSLEAKIDMVIQRQRESGNR